MDASVKSTLPPRFWSVATVFAAFFGLLTVASIWRIIYSAALRLGFIALSYLDSKKAAFDGRPIQYSPLWRSGRFPA